MAKKILRYGGLAVAVSAICVGAVGVGRSVSSQRSHPDRVAIVSDRAPAAVNTQPAATSSTPVSYPDEGIQLAAPDRSAGGAVAPDAASSSAVVSSFKKQELVQELLGDDSTQPVAAAQTITESLPIVPSVSANVPYQGWVVTVAGVTPFMTGASNPSETTAPTPPPAPSNCSLVGTMRSATGEWTNIFETCHKQ